MKWKFWLKSYASDTHSTDTLSDGLGTMNLYRYETAHKVHNKKWPDGARIVSAVTELSSLCKNTRMNLTSLPKLSSSSVTPFTISRFTNTQSVAVACPRLAAVHLPFMALARLSPQLRLLPSPGCPHVTVPNILYCQHCKLLFLLTASSASCHLLTKCRPALDTSPPELWLWVEHSFCFCLLLFFFRIWEGGHGQVT